MKRRTLLGTILLFSLLMAFSSFAAVTEKKYASPEELATEIATQYEELNYLDKWEYPKTFKSDRQKALKLLKEFDEKAKKSGTIAIYEMDFLIPVKVESKEVSETLDSSFFRYYGDIKDGHPNGMGILFNTTLNNQVYVGYFKKGKPTKYGLKFDNYGAPMWECDKPELKYKAFNANGKGILYYCIESDLKGLSDEGLARSNHLNHISDGLEKVISLQEFPKETAGSVLRLLKSNRIILHPLVYYEGGLDETIPDGKGKIYYDAFDEWAGDRSVETSYEAVKGAYGQIGFEGKMKNGGGTGKCKLYFPDGTLQYDGELKNGKMHGKGTLYNSDGSVKHKGKFKNGDIA